MLSLTLAAIGAAIIVALLTHAFDAPTMLSRRVVQDYIRRHGGRRKPA